MNKNIPTRQQAWMDLNYFDGDKTFDGVQARFDAVQCLHAYAAGELKTEEEWLKDHQAASATRGNL